MARAVPYSRFAGHLQFLESHKISLMNVSASGEFGLIARLQQNLVTRGGVQLGIGDDGAVLDAIKNPIVTCDALIENVHFRRNWTSAHALGIKALAVNVSDLAAMGAHPVAAFITLALPRDGSVRWVEEFYAGMESLAARYEFTIAGGDTTGAPLVMISVTLIGELMPQARGHAVLRSGAQFGDAVCVSGNLGDSAAGLELLLHPRENFDGKYLLQRHREPTPRVEAMRAWMGANRDAIHAVLDLSDGLAGDAGHIARASGVDIQVDAENLPISPKGRALAEALDKSPLDWALRGGEDYELCLCVAPDAVDSLRAASDVALTVVGRVVEGTGEVRILENGKPRATGAAWTHF